MPAGSHANSLPETDYVQDLEKTVMGVLEQGLGTNKRAGFGEFCMWKVLVVWTPKGAIIYPKTTVSYTTTYDSGLYN
jgi:hypothetical protein